MQICFAKTKEILENQNRLTSAVNRSWCCCRTNRCPVPANRTWFVWNGISHLSLITQSHWTCCKKMFAARGVTKDKEILWRFASFGADNCVRQRALTIVCGNMRSQMCTALCAHKWNESMRFGLDGRGSDDCVRQCALILMRGNVRSQMCATTCAHNWNESMRFGLDGKVMY